MASNLAYAISGASDLLSAIFLANKQYLYSDVRLCLSAKVREADIGPLERRKPPSPYFRGQKLDLALRVAQCQVKVIWKQKVRG